MKKLLVLLLLLSGSAWCAPTATFTPIPAFYEINYPSNTPFPGKTNYRKYIPPQDVIGLPQLMYTATPVPTSTPVPTATNIITPLASWYIPIAGGSSTGAVVFNANATTTPPIVAIPYNSATTTKAYIQTLASLFLCADDNVLPNTDGASVSQVITSGTSPQTLTQATAGNRPVLKLSILNGHAVIRNNAGVTQFLTSGTVTTSSIFASQTWTVYAVLKQDGTGSGRTFLEARNPDATNYIKYATDNSSGNIQYIYGTTNKTVAQPSGWVSNFHILSYAHDSDNTQRIYADSVSLLGGTNTDVFSTSGSTTIFVMSGQGGGSNNYKGDLACLIIIPQYIAPGSALDKQIYNYLATYYGLPVYPATQSHVFDMMDWLGTVRAWVDENFIAHFPGGIFTKPVSITRPYNSPVTDLYIDCSIGDSGGNAIAIKDPSGLVRFYVTNYGVVCCPSLVSNLVTEAYQTRTTSVTLTGANQYQAINTNSGNVTLTLSAGTNYSYNMYDIWKSTSDANLVVVITDGTEIFSSGTTIISLSKQYELVGIYKYSVPTPQMWEIKYHEVGLEPYPSFTNLVTFGAGVTTTTLGASGLITANGGITTTSMGVSGPSTYNGPTTYTGTGTFWNDIQFNIASGHVPGANAPTWGTWDTDFGAYSFAVNDYIDLGTVEVPHSWKQGSVVKPHIHWIANGTDVDARAVKWDLVYTWINSSDTSPYTYVFPAPLTLSSEVTLQAGVTDRTSIFQDFGSVTMTGGIVGAEIKARLRRTAAAGTAPSNNPFAIQVGIHEENDTPGSRSASSK